MPDVLGSFLAGLTDIFGSHPGAEYSDLYKQLAEKYGRLNPNISAEQQGFDEPTRGGMLDAMGQYRDIANQGGLDAIGRSQIAEANARTGQEASAMSNAIQQRAGAGPARNSGVTLSLMEQAGQGAADRGALAGQSAAAGAEQRQRGALGGYFGAAQGAGAAADAIDRYNTMLRQGTKEGNYQRQLQQLEGQGESYAGGYGAARGDQAQWRRGLGSIGHSVDEGYEVFKDWMPMMGGGMGGKGR